MVSNFGRIKSKERFSHPSASIKAKSETYRIKERIKKQTFCKGYLVVKLCKENIKISAKVHRLVAIAFLDNPNNFKEVNHKDECRSNNHVSNLEWCDCYYNCNYGNRNKKISASQLNTELKSKKVIQYNIISKTVTEWSSLCELARFGYDRKLISEICRGKTNKKVYKDSNWKFK